MSTTTFRKNPKDEWRPEDPRLLRAAQRIIRLYDLGQVTVYSAKAESLATVIAHELNRSSGDESQ